MKNEIENIHALKSFEEWIVECEEFNMENEAETVLTFVEMSQVCDLDDLLQAEGFKQLLKNHPAFFEGIYSIDIDAWDFEDLYRKDIDDSECDEISKESGPGLELLCQALKNVTELKIDNGDHFLDEEILKYLKLDKLVMLELSGMFKKGEIESLLQNHPNIRNLEAKVVLHPQAFSYMKNLEKLDLNEGGLETYTMDLLARELRKIVRGNLEDCLVPKLWSLDANYFMDGVGEDNEQYFEKHVLPDIWSFRAFIDKDPLSDRTHRRMITYEKKDKTYAAIKKLETFAKMPLHFSGVSNPVKEFLSRIQGSPFWKDQELFSKYIAPTLIKMLKELRVGFTTKQGITTRNSEYFTDVKESVKGCSTNATGTILAYYALEKCNAFIEKIKKENTSITNEEIMTLVIANETLILDITPIILTEYINVLITQKNIHDDRSELIAKALKVFAGEEFSYQEKDYKVTNPIALPSSISSFNMPGLILKLKKIFKDLLVFQENGKASIKGDKLTQLIRAYLERFISLDNKTTWARNLKSSCQTNEEMKAIISDMHTHEDLNAVINAIIRGQVIDVDAKTETEYVTNVTKYLRKLNKEEAEDVEKKDRFISKKRDFDKPLEKEDYLDKNKKLVDFGKSKNDDSYSLNKGELFEGKGLIDFELDNMNEAKRTAQPPTLEELQISIKEEGLNTYAFEPITLSYLDYKHSSQDEILDEIHKNIMNLLYSNEHKDRNNFICLLPDNYHISENGEFSGAHYICILRKGDTYKIFDPLTAKCASNPLYALIKNVKTKLGFSCFYGTQDVLDANTCAKNCIHYIKSQSLELKNKG
jgi:hypothetical protein